MRFSGRPNPIHQIHALSDAEDLCDPVGDLLGLRQNESFQITGRDGQVGRSDPFYRDIKEIKCLSHNLHPDLGSRSATEGILVNDNDTTGLFHRYDHGLDIQGLKRTRIDNLYADPFFLLKQVGYLPSDFNHIPGGDDGNVLPASLDIGYAERNRIVPIRDRPFSPQ